MDPLRLVGTWDFLREIQDHRDGARYSVSGTAELVQQDDGRVRWTEHGTLTWASGSTPISRTLFLVRDPAWRVTFEDGRDFHPWTGGAVEHLCGRDSYAGGIQVPTTDPTEQWDVRWRVTGPEKDYTMHTTYSAPSVRCVRSLRPERATRRNDHAHSGETEVRSLP